MSSTDEQKCTKRIGHYLLEENDENKLGEGAFGKVYRAEHADSGISVAVKKIAKEKAKFDELQAVKQLNHDHVITIIDLHIDHGSSEDEPGDYVYIILELCDTDLRAHLKRESDNRLDTVDLDCVTECLARGYLALYDRSIIHRDLKPENILLKYDSNGRIRVAKIGDFGASRLMSSVDADDSERPLNGLAGTPLYMAPEIGANIVMDRQYDAKVDMWSMGIVLYECIHGQVPFDEMALCRLFLFSANANYEGYMGPPCPAHSKISISYEALMNRLLELDVDERLNASEFYCWIVHQKLLADPNAIVELHPNQPYSRKRRFRLRGLQNCCNTVQTRVHEKFETNNNNTENDQCNKCNVDDGICKMDMGKKDQEISLATYAFERCVWYSGMFVACNYCCFSMRQYGYEF